MRRLVTIAIAVVIAVIVLAGGIAVFRHETATVASDETALRKDTRCPASTPDACVSAAAAAFGLPVSAMPGISIPAGFTYRSGSVGRDGAGAPNAAFDFAVGPDTFTFRVAARGSFSTQAVNQMKSWTVTEGRAGRQYREVGDRAGVASLVYIDPTFVYSVDTAQGDLTASAQLTPATQILDAIH